ncbi:MAG TPA: flavin prenyltransferase UbiX [Acidobacteriota bacterium]
MELTVGISGASGAAYAVRLLQALHRSEPIKKVHLVISTNGFLLLKQEMGIHLSANRFKIGQLIGEDSDKFALYDNMNFFSPIASGSYPTDGMIIIPCSTGTLGAIAGGVSSNLMQRGAEVALKERKKLVLVLRETPLSLIHLENCVRITQAGGVILPASPGFYHRPTEIRELVDFIVARVLDLFQLPHSIGKRWGKKEKSSG